MSFYRNIVDLVCTSQVIIPNVEATTKFSISQYIPSLLRKQECNIKIKCIYIFPSCIKKKTTSTQTLVIIIRSIITVVVVIVRLVLPTIRDSIR